MTCANCHTQANRIVVQADGSEVCPSCTNLTETGGIKTDGLLTRNSLRVRRDSVMHEGDLVLPHRYDKGTKKYVPNERFIERNPNQVHRYYRPDELAPLGYGKLTEKIKQDERTIVEHQVKLQGAHWVGDAKEAVKKHLKLK